MAKYRLTVDIEVDRSLTAAELQKLEEKLVDESENLLEADLDVRLVDQFSEVKPA